MEAALKLMGIDRNPTPPGETTPLPTVPTDPVDAPASIVASGGNWFSRRLSRAVPTTELLPFKKGAFHLAVQSGCPIIPVVCENYSKLVKKNKYWNRGTLKLQGE